MPFAEQLHQVRLKNHADAMEQCALTMTTDAELLTNPAVGTVSRHQILCANRARAPAFPLADQGSDALFVLLETHQFSAEAQIPPEPLGMRAQNWLHYVLSSRAAARRAAVTLEEGFDIFLQHIKLLAPQAFCQQNVATHGQACFDLVNGLLDPYVTEQLHRRLAQGRNTWMDRGAGMALNQQRGNAAPGEEEGGGE